MCRLRLRPYTSTMAMLLVIAAGATASCAAAAQRAQFWGFTAPWDARSDSTIHAHGGKLDALITGWITIDSASGQPIVPSSYADRTNPRTGTPDRMALVTSWHGTGFHAEPIRTLARDPLALASAAGTLARYVADNGYEGIVFDFETLERADLDAHLRVLRAMADSAHAHGVSTIAVAIPATDTAAYPAAPLLQVADALIVMLYDQHWLGSEPGPVADPRWVRDALRLRLSEVGPERLVAGLPLYGYRWRPGAPTEPVSYLEALAHAAATGAPLQRDPESGTLRSTAPDGAETWVTDAELLRVLVDQTRAEGVHAFALWRLGQEDPAVWTTVFD